MNLKSIKVYFMIKKFLGERDHICEEIRKKDEFINSL